MAATEVSLAVSDAAEATGLTTHTLRYYERAGLMLTPIDRAGSTHRRYSEADIEWVAFLTKLRATSMPIRRVREYVELVRAGETTTLQRLDLLVAHRETVLADLDEMARSLAAIDTKIAIYQEKAGSQ